MSSNYSAEKIEILEGLEAVRLRPGMYIGGTGNHGLHHILWEIIDNSIDEVANGYGNTVEITLMGDNVARVADNGRGIPVDIHPKLKVSGVEVVFTQLHAGGKFNNDSYAYSGGLHGVGASVTNALSEWLTVEVFKDGNEYRQDFHSPEVNGKIKSGVPVGSLKLVGKTKKTGTQVTFKPDTRVFKNEKIQLPDHCDASSRNRFSEQVDYAYPERQPSRKRRRHRKTKRLSLRRRTFGLRVVYQRRKGRDLRKTYSYHGGTGRRTG